MDTFLRIAGAVLVGVSLLDVFLTVLYARSGAGVLVPILSKGLWRFFRFLSQPFGDKRSLILSFAGPTILIMIAATWAMLVVLGFALIFLPELGSGLTKSLGPTPTDFITALYYSGYCFTTLGIGDISPSSGGIRLLTVTEAAFGFSLFTLTITYFFNVYGALNRRNVLASNLHHKTARTGNAGAYVVSFGTGGGILSASQDLSDLASRTADLLEAHTFYPVVHYFHFRHLRYGMPRITLLLMDIASLAQTLPLPGRETLLSAATQVETATRDLLERMAEVFLPDFQPEEYAPEAEEIEAWRRHYGETVRGLDGGAEFSERPPKGEARYIELRRQWHPYIAAFSTSLGYELEQVVPSRKLP